MKSTQRPAVRLLLFGSFFVLVKLLFEAIQHGGVNIVSDPFAPAGIVRLLESMLEEKDGVPWILRPRVEAAHPPEEGGRRGPRARQRARTPRRMRGSRGSGSRCRDRDR